MSDTTPFGFGKFVPGFDFLQSLAKGATGSIPKMPNLSNWVAPTISVEELEKRVDELKAVQFWLEQNSRALSATIQALEVQKMTLATLQGMNFTMGDMANAFKLKTTDAVMGGMHKAGETLAGAAQAVASAATRAAESVTPAPAPAAEAPPKADTAKEAPATGQASVVDPMQWWGALTQQFQQIATSAMTDAAKQTALDTTKGLATGLAKDALKTATDMAAKGVQTMQDATRRAAGVVAPARSPAPAAAKKTTAAKKPATRKAAAKPAVAAKKAAPRRPVTKAAR